MRISARRSTSSNEITNEAATLRDGEIVATEVPVCSCFT